MKNLRRSDADTSVTDHLGRLTLSQRREQLVSGETTTDTLTKATRATNGVPNSAAKTLVKGTAKSVQTAAQRADGGEDDLQGTGSTATRRTGRAAARTGRRAGQRLAKTATGKAFGKARDGRASVRSQRASKAVRGGLIARQRRKTAQTTALKGGKDAATVIGTSAPRLGLVTSRAATAAVAIVRTIITAVIGAFTGSPVILITATVIGLVMAVLATVAWLVPGAQNEGDPVIVTGSWANPAMGRISSPYGWRVHPVLGVAKLHDGTDIAGPSGDPVNAAGTGTVIHAGPATAYGNHYVVIDHGAGLLTKYGHMSAHTVQEGDVVNAGQQIGSIGSEGYSTGPHLHFIVEIGGKTTDPEPFFADRGIILGQTPLDQIAGGDAGGITMVTANIPMRSGADGFKTSMSNVLDGQPDFVALQEQFGRSTTDVERAASGYTAYRDPSPGNAPGDEQLRSTMILYESNTWQLIAAGRLTIAEDDMVTYNGTIHTWDRGATWAQLKRRSDGMVVSVFSVHHMTNPAKWGPDKPARQRMYAKGMNTILAKAQQLSAAGPVFVGGDMNTGMGEADTSWAAVPKMKAAGYRWAGNGVDFIFHSARIPLGNSTTGTMNSDHKFVKATFNLTVGAKEYAASVLNNDDEFECLDELWTHESNWNPLADNPTSSAYGIPQALPGDKMASAGDDWKTNPITQVKWGLGYIAERYGTPCQAWATWQSNDPHWY